jgi:hypothetical protein
VTRGPIVRDSTGDPVYAYSRSATRDGRGRKATKRASPEADLQRSVIAYLHWALDPNLYRFRVGMEGARRGKWEALQAHQLGLSKGWPDIMLLNRVTRACRWIELKSDTGRLTREQSEIADDLRDHMAVCRSLPEVERALLAWGVKPKCSIADANRTQAGGAFRG